MRLDKLYDVTTKHLIPPLLVLNITIGAENLRLYQAQCLTMKTEAREGKCNQSLLLLPPYHKWLKCHSSLDLTERGNSFSPAYDNDEPDYDPEEPVEPYDPDEQTHADPDDIALGQNPDQLLTTGDRGVVISDPGAQANRGKAEKAPKDKKIPNDQRTTTPYMTKYERARILGTRALQIRLVSRGIQRLH